MSLRRKLVLWYTGVFAVSGKIEEEIAAIELRSALEDIGTVTGRSRTPELLDRIFRDFCVGK